MKVTSWNLLHGQSLPLAEPSLALTQQELLGIIGRSLTSDVVGLQEVDFNQNRSGEYSQIELIAEGMGAPFWAYARTLIGTPGINWRKLKPDEPIIQTNDHITSQSHRKSGTESGTESGFNSEASYGIGLISRIKVISWHTLSLGKSMIGLPLASPAIGKNGKKQVKLVYVKDEPRIALAAQLENGITIAVTHLSFVPFVNIYQLRKTQKWLAKFPGKHILLGDLNLPFNIPRKVSRWSSLISQLTYPSWEPKVQFDYILSDSISASEVKKINPPDKFSEENPSMIISDHLSLTVEI